MTFQNLSEDKPWAKLGMTRRQYDTSKPWKKAGLSRVRFDAFVLALSEEAIAGLRQDAIAESLMKAMGFEVE